MVELTIGRRRKIIFAKLGEYIFDIMEKREEKARGYKVIRLAYLNRRCKSWESWVQCVTIKRNRGPLWSIL